MREIILREHYRKLSKEIKEKEEKRREKEYIEMLKAIRIKKMEEIQ